MPPRGRFITLEGGEGAGKSTLAMALVAELKSRGLEVVLTREPGGAPPAEAIRSLLLEPGRNWEWRPLTEALLFNAARHEHLEEVIRPALAAGEWVICDRFADSTRAYQLAASNDIEQEVSELQRMVVGATEPDLTLILDLDPASGRERVKKRGQAIDAIEAREEGFHARVRRVFLDIAAAAPDRCVVLDASQPPDTLARLAMDAIASRLDGAPE